MRTFVTGFLGFGRFDENPSATLARESGRPFALLEVRYAAVDRFLEALDPNAFDALLMLGVAGGATRFRLERVGRNRHGPLPDVGGHVPTGETIDDGNGAIASTLWCDATVAACVGDDVATSDDAGDYLCNYALRRALRAFPTKRVGFLHVPPVESVAIEAQRATLDRVLRSIEGGADFPRPFRLAATTV